MPKFFCENPMTHGFWYSIFLCYFTNGQITIGTIHFPNFWDVFFIFCVEGCHEHSLSTEVQPSLKRLSHSWVCVLLTASCPKLVLTFWKSPKPFSLIWNKILHKHIALENHSVLIDKKFAKQARYVFTLMHTAQWLSKLEWSGLWHLPKETHRYAAQSAGPCSIFTLTP